MIVADQFSTTFLCSLVIRTKSILFCKNLLARLCTETKSGRRLFGQRSSCTNMQYFLCSVGHYSCKALLLVQSVGGEDSVIGRGLTSLLYCWFHVLRFSVLSCGLHLPSHNPHIPISCWSITPASLFSCWHATPRAHLMGLGSAIPTSPLLLTAASQHNFTGREYSPKNVNQQLFT